MYQSPCPFLRVDDCFTVKKKSKKKGKIPMSLYIGIIIGSFLVGLLGYYMTSRPDCLVPTRPDVLAIMEAEK